MSCGIHKNDIGTVLLVTIYDNSNNIIDISSADAKQIILKKPSGNNLTKTATFTTDGSDGKIQYITQSGDLDEIGTWKIQGKIIVGSYEWYSSLESFKVHRNL